MARRQLPIEIFQAIFNKFDRLEQLQTFMVVNKLWNKAASDLFWERALLKFVSGEQVTQFVHFLEVNPSFDKARKFHYHVYLNEAPMSHFKAILQTFGESMKELWLGDRIQRGLVHENRVDLRLHPRSVQYHLEVLIQEGIQLPSLKILTVVEQYICRHLFTATSLYFSVLYKFREQLTYVGFYKEDNDDTTLLQHGGLMFISFQVSILERGFHHFCQWLTNRPSSIAGQLQKFKKN